MNTKQKIVAAIALAVFAATLLWSPWTVTLRRGENHWAYSVVAPVWGSPNQEGPHDAELRIGTLLVEWAAIGIFAGSLLMIFREKH